MKKDKWNELWNFNEEDDFYSPISRISKYVFPNTFDKNKPLHTSPHYSDNRFNEPQTVFGKEEKGIGYDYSDRLWQWDYEKSEQAVETAEKSGFPRHSCNWYEAYLSAYFGKKVEIKHILAGVNVSNGYPYAVFGYRFIEK